MPAVPAPTRPEDPDEPAYPQLLRTPRHRWWRPLLGLLVGALVLVAVGVVVVLVATGIRVAQGVPLDEVGSDALSPDSPLGLAANNLVIAGLLPAAALAVLAAHRGASPRLLVSVTGRLRWRPLVAFGGLAALLVCVSFALSLLVDVPGDDSSAGSPSTVVGLLVVIVMTTPLQSAGEEAGFRGYLTQAIGSWFARPALGAVVAAVVTATLFALAHGGQDPWLFADRLSFGLVASWLVWRTGGLEASIALHAVNNLVSLGFTALTGSIEDSLTTGSLDWRLAAIDVAMMLAYTRVVTRYAERRGMAVRAPSPAGPPSALSGSPAVGYPVHRSDPPRPAGNDNPWGMG